MIQHPESDYQRYRLEVTGRIWTCGDGCCSEAFYTAELLERQPDETYSLLFGTGSEVSSATTAEKYVRDWAQKQGIVLDYYTCQETLEIIDDREEVEPDG